MSLQREQGTSSESKCYCSRELDSACHAEEPVVTSEGDKSTTWAPAIFHEGHMLGFVQLLFILWSFVFLHRSYQSDFDGWEPVIQ